MTLAHGMSIDATSKGNHSRFINHSCSPNAHTEKWSEHEFEHLMDCCRVQWVRYSTFSRDGPLSFFFFRFAREVGGFQCVGIFASTEDIPPNTEITFDYQYERYGGKRQPSEIDQTLARVEIVSVDTRKENGYLNTLRFFFIMLSFGRCYCGSSNCAGFLGQAMGDIQLELNSAGRIHCLTYLSFCFLLFQVVDLAPSPPIVLVVLRQPIRIVEFTRRSNRITPTPIPSSPRRGRPAS